MKIWWWVGLLLLLLGGVGFLLWQQAQTAAPTITQINPSASPYGTTVIITGTHLGGQQGDNVYLRDAGGRRYGIATLTVGEAKEASRSGQLQFRLAPTVGGPRNRNPAPGPYQLHVETYSVKGVPTDSNSLPFTLLP